MKRSRIAAALSLSIPIMLLVGAATVKTRQRLDHRTELEKALLEANRDFVLGLGPRLLSSRTQCLERWIQAGLDSAVEYFGRATSSIPHMRGLRGLADAYVMLGYFGYRPSDAMFQGEAGSPP